MTMPTNTRIVVLILSRPVEECGQGGWGRRWARIIINEACVGAVDDSGVLFDPDKLINLISKVKGVDETEKLDAVKKIREHFAAPASKIVRYYS